jgi:hypothetical protein
VNKPISGEKWRQVMRIEGVPDCPELEVSLDRGIQVIREGCELFPE